MSRDIFISYSSSDYDWVTRLKAALEQRGLFVWLDKFEIRPGDFFARSIEEGLETSRSVFVVLTDASLRSTWVAEEYYRALTLANSKKIQLIPILLNDVEAPGFLSSRQYVRFLDKNFESTVDRLVWPGVTGKSIAGIAFDSNCCDEPHHRLHQAIQEELGIYIGRLSESRLHEWFPTWRDDEKTMGHQIFPKDRTAGVVFLDDHPELVEFIFKCRSSTDGVNERLQFVICAQPNWLNRFAAAGVKQEYLDRLSHYFHIDLTVDFDSLKQSLRRVWNDTQRDLLQRERITW